MGYIKAIMYWNTSSAFAKRKEKEILRQTTYREKRKKFDQARRDFKQIELKSLDLLERKSETGKSKLWKVLKLLNKGGNSLENLDAKRPKI